MLNDPVLFPSRVVVSRTAASNFPNLARRLYRCLSHAWRHHAAVYAAYETETRAAARFTGLARRYGLLAEEQLLIPFPLPSASGGAAGAAQLQQAAADAAPGPILLAAAPASGLTGRSQPQEMQV